MSIVAFAALVVCGGAFFFGPLIITKPAAPALPPDQARVVPPAREAAPTAHMSTIIDLPGDPVLIERRTDTEPQSVKLKVPASLSAAAPSREIAAELIGASLVPNDGTVITKFPEEGPTASELVEASPEPIGEAPAYAGEQTVVADGPSDGTGGYLEGFQAYAMQFGDPDTTTRLAVAVGGTDARRDVKTVLIRVAVDEPIGDLLVRSGFAEPSSRAVEEASAAILNVRTIPAGGLVVAKGPVDSSGTYFVAQLSIYEAREYVGTIAISETGAFVAGAETYVPQTVIDATPKASAFLTRFSLSDGLYSAALRSNVPEPIVREAILLMSKITDLKKQLESGDAMRLLFSREPRDGGSGGGHVIYLGLTLASGQVDCYVFRVGDDEFRCTDGSGTAKGGDGIFAPVTGARMSSLFGMRLHPILHIFRLHAGVDWATPVGTPVMAVADGTISFAGIAGGFGNHVRIQHPGFETSYSHLERFAEGATVGKAVKQGDLIGYSGNSGLSTGPHLHFQYYIDKTPVDPLLHMEARNSVPDQPRLATFQTARATIDAAMSQPVATP